MLGNTFKLSLLLNVLFLFTIFLWQAATANASPILASNDNLAKTNDDDALSLLDDHNKKGSGVVKRSLHTTIDQDPLIDASRFRSRSRHRYLKKKFRPTKLKNSPHIFQSTGTYNEDPKASNRLGAILDDRLKRFRMLDPDEFQEMLNSFNQQHTDEQSKGFNGADTLGGMQLENYWSRK